MASPMTTGEVTIQLDKERIICYDMEAMFLYEELTGDTILSLFLQLIGDPAIITKVQTQGVESLTQEDRSGIMTRLGFIKLRLLFYVGMKFRYKEADEKGNNQELTLEKAGHLMNYAEGAGPFIKFVYILSKVTEAVLATQGISLASLKKEAQEGKVSSLQVSGTSKLDGIGTALEKLPAQS